MSLTPLQDMRHPQILAHRQRLSDTNADAAPLLSLRVLHATAEYRKEQRTKRATKRKAKRK
jgi:hypothetical protein